MVNRGGVGAVFARRQAPLVFALLVLGCGLLLRRDASQPRRVQTSAPANPAQIRAAFGRLPMSFEPNQGQIGANDSVKFLARGNGYGLYLTPGKAMLAFAERGTGKRSQSVVEMQLGGANQNAGMSGTDRLPGSSNYFIGNDPSQWRTNIPQFARVQYRDVYPGVDLAFYGKQGRLEYDFDVNPGGDPRQIELDFRGAKSLNIAPNGDLVLALDGRELRFQAPHIYQKSSAGTQAIVGSFALRKNKGNVAGFDVGPYDRSRTLVIDPVLTFSTYLGGSGDESCTTITGAAVGFVPHCPAIAVDSASRVYVAGATTSTGTFSGSTPQIIGVAGTAEVFVARFTSAGDALEYVTYIGGSGTQYPTGVGVDSGFNAFVAGTTDSANYPTINGLPVTTLAAGNHAFLTKLDSSGSANLYSTYLAGAGADMASSLALDGLGRAYVFGTTSSPDFPTTTGSLQPAPAATNQFFFSKIDTTSSGLSSLLYSTYFGGSLPSGGTVTGGAVAVDSAFNVYLAGGTDFTNMPTVNAFQATPPTAGPKHAWVARLNAPPANTQQYAPLYETYVSGDGTDIAYGVATDGTNTFITGSTTSSNLTSLVTATTPFQTALGGGTDAFVAKLGLPTTTGTTTGSVPLLYSSYLGGSANDQGLAIAVDTVGDARITGKTASSNFPVSTSPPPIQGTLRGTSDAFVARIATNTTSTTTTSNAVTFLGGTGTEAGTSIALDAALNTYVTGETSSGSSTFPLTPPALGTPLQSDRSGPTDAFVSKLGASTSGLSLPSFTPSNASPPGAKDPTVSPTSVGVGGTVTFTYLIFNTGDPVAGVAFTDVLGGNTTLGSIAASPSPAGSCPSGGLVCNLGTVGTSTISSSVVSPAVTVTVTVTVTAPPVTGSTTQINNVGKLTVAGSTFQQTATGVAQVNDFSISASPLAAPPIIAGAAATYTVTVAPTSFGGFPGAVNLACGSGLPSGATCTFAPGSSIPNLNGGSQSRSLQISTQARVTTPASLFFHGGPTYAIWLPVFGLMGAGISRKRRMLLGAFFAVCLALILLQAGCGSSSSSSSTTTGTPAGSYTVTLNATSGTAATRTTTVGLVVQ